MVFSRDKMRRGGYKLNGRKVNKETVAKAAGRLLNDLGAFANCNKRKGRKRRNIFIPLSSSDCGIYLKR